MRFIDLIWCLYGALSFPINSFLKNCFFLISCWIFQSNQCKCTNPHICAENRLCNIYMWLNWWPYWIINRLLYWKFIDLLNEKWTFFMQFKRIASFYSAAKVIHTYTYAWYLCVCVWSESKTDSINPIHFRLVVDIAIQFITGNKFIV